MFLEHSLKDINKFYSEDPSDRYQHLIQKFNQIYNTKPDFISRAPGRVNIIGQHIDYEGYGVFPSAIEKDCLIAVKITNSNEIQIQHFDSKTYPSFKNPKNPNVYTKYPYPNKYLQYVISGYRAGVQHIEDTSKIVGLQIMITGNVPLGSGVSSSAALIVSSALASYYANKQNGVRESSDFIESCIKRQRECGVASGGMDQSISVMGKLSSCLYIEFNPIRCTKVSVPEGCKLIIMNSLVENVKADSALFRYNKRVVQCRLALYLMAKNLGIDREVYQKWKILKELQEHLKLTIRMTSYLVPESIPRKQYTKKDIQELFGADIWASLQDIQRSKQVLEVNDTFHLFEAAQHVFTQTQRVLDLIQICNSSLKDSEKNIFFGKLMNESHESCRDVYHCSSTQLDQLTSTALKHGALGSRLTGAGWGGCTVSLVQNEKVQDFIQNMKKTYYSQQPFKQRADKQGIDNVIFVSKPGEGAFITLLE